MKKRLNTAEAVLMGLLGPRLGLLDRIGRSARRVRKWAPSGAGEQEKARRRLQLARGLLSFGPHGRGVR